jgi:hypothetical protein
MSLFTTSKIPPKRTSELMTYSSSLSSPRTEILASQNPMENQAFSRFVRLGSSEQSNDWESEKLIVITDELTSAECVDFFMRDPEVSDQRTGTLVHKALQDWMDKRFGKRFKLPLPTGSKAPLEEKSHVVGGVRQGPGYFDLAYTSEQLRIVEGAELKPANVNGYTDGLEELKWYLDKGNADEDLKRRHGIIEFRPMEPWKFPLPRPLYVESRRFRLIWCSPGVILYKEIAKRKSERDEEATKRTQPAKLAKGSGHQKAQSSLTGHIEAGALPNSRVLVLNEAVSPEEASLYVWGREGYLDSSRGVPSDKLPPGQFQSFYFENLDIPLVHSMRPHLKWQYFNASFGQQAPMKLPSWAPVELRDAYRQGIIPQGLDTTRWKVGWPGGFSSALLVNRRNHILEVQALWPSERQFYELYGQKVGEDETFSRRLHSVCTEWNADLLSLLETSRRTQNGYVSISDARDQLREINAAIARLLATGFAIAFGAAATSLGSARPPTIKGIGVAGRARTVVSPENVSPMESGDAADELIAMIRAILERKVPVPVP